MSQCPSRLLPLLRSPVHNAPMGIDAFKTEIQRFLANSDAEVLCITGGWGVGKTFAWNKFLREARSGKSIALKHYAYVSLFGLTSLDEVKRAVFENTVEKAKAGDSADMQTLEGAVKTVTSSWRSGGALARMFAPFADYATAFEKIGFFSVRNQIVCVDDLERKSGSVDMRDILGLISQLKEQRGCKIVILLNDEKLGDDDKEFRLQLEKVADTTIRFEPTPVEAADIGIDLSTPFHSLLKEDCVSLKIVNIRTIRKLERHAKRLEEELKHLDPRVLKQAVHSATLFGFAKYQPDSAPALDFIETYNPYGAVSVRSGEEITHPEWRELIREFGFSHVDDFDRVVLAGIKQGHFDVEKLKLEGEKVDRKLRDVDNDQVFGEAWDLYHNSFDDNAEEVMERLSSALRSAPQVVSPTNLSGTISLLKELGWKGNVSELIDVYVSKRNEDRRFWDLDEGTFGDEAKDPDVRKAFAKKLASFRDERDPAVVMIEVGKENGWNHEDIAYLASLSSDTYYEVYKRLSGMDLRRAIRAGLLFRNIAGADDHMKTIGQKAEKALKKIAAESEINLRRVRQRGVAVVAKPPRKRRVSPPTPPSPQSPRPGPGTS